MSIVDDYPKMHRDETARLRARLRQIPGLGPRDCEDIALAVNDMADKAHDLNDIFRRLLEEQYATAEFVQLLVAFEVTSEQIRGTSDTLREKVYEIVDRLEKLPESGSE